MDNCDSHGRSSSTGSELKRVYEYSSRFCSAVVIYLASFYFLSCFYEIPRIMQLHIEQ